MMFKTLIEDMASNSKDAIRRSELSQKEAKKILGEYLTDIYTSEGNVAGEEISNIDLFKLKKLVADDANFIRAQQGKVLSPREKVVLSTWKTIDDAVATLNPEVKKLTLKQSDLYNATKSLDKLRRAKPNIKVPGTDVGVPASTEQWTKSSIADILNPVSNVTNKTASVVNSPALEQLLGQTGGRYGSLTGQIPTAEPSIDTGTSTDMVSAKDQRKITPEQMQMVLLSPDISAKNIGRLRC